MEESMNTFLISIIAVVAGVVIGIVIMKISNKAGLDQAVAKSKSILEEANAKAETTVRQAEIEGKQQIFEMKQQAEKELKSQKDKVQQTENKLLRREDNLNFREENLNAKEKKLDEKNRQADDKLANLSKMEEDLQAKIDQQISVLERAANLSVEDAKKELMDAVAKKSEKDVAAYLHEQDELAQEKAADNARNIIATAIQRYSQEEVIDRTVSVVTLPNEDMKGRIQPGRIEEVVAKVTKELDETIMKIGDEAVFKLGINRLNRELTKLVGKLRYRYSYGQNVLEHSMEVATFAGIMAAELGLNQQLAKRAGLLHDIGKAIDFEQEGSHVELGAKAARKYGENAIVVNAIESHHGDKPADDIIAVLVAAADTLSAARPGARYESMENYIQRLEQLEKIASSYDGVKTAFAIQAGRELRVMVEPAKANDERMVKIAHDIKDRIENELTYPGQIKVTVIREVRAQEIAQ